MIPDKIFKSLKHSRVGFETLYNGQELEPGYKPDYVLKKGNEYIILESENTSSRKTYVGGLIKAAHYLQNGRKGKLIFVVVPKDNTKASSIANHLRSYYNWIKDKTNLNEIYVIESSKYYCNNVLLDIFCNDFKKHAFKV